MSKKRIEKPEFKVGDRAIYRGMGILKACTITDIGEKNGELVYDCELDIGQSVWGYANQFGRMG